MRSVLAGRGDGARRGLRLSRLRPARRPAREPAVCLGRRAAASTAAAASCASWPLRRPPDAAQAAGRDRARPVHPDADVCLRPGAAGRQRWRMVSLARLRQEFYGLPAEPGAAARARAQGSAARSSATRSAWCTARTRAAPCRWPPPSGQLDAKGARLLRRLRGACWREDRRSRRSMKTPLANSGRRRRRSDVRIAGRLAARGRLRGGHRRLRPRGRGEGARARTTPSTSSI